LEDKLKFCQKEVGRETAVGWARFRKGEKGERGLAEEPVQFKAFGLHRGEADIFASFPASASG